MRALGVVAFNVVLDAFTQFLDIVRGIDIYTLALDCSPAPFYPNIIQTPAPSVHAHAYSFASLFPCWACVLTALVAIEFLHLMLLFGAAESGSSICQEFLLPAAKLSLGNFILLGDVYQG